MQTLREVYTAHQIMSGLQMHQLRVAAVAKMIADNIEHEVDERSIILACLFHDMGNIIKSDLGHFKEFMNPEGLPYWQKVKNEFVEKYGTSSHRANVAIARELKLPAKVVALVDGVGFANLSRTAEAGSWEQKIVEYGDCRVGPYGVLPLRERHEEARARYLLRPQHLAHDKEGYEKEVHSSELVEAQLFSQCKIRPSDINDASIAPIIEQLWNYDLQL